MSQQEENLSTSLDVSVDVQDCSDRPGGPQRVSFDGDAWLDYVPIRVPDTVSVQERLPPGAATVLINRTHTYTDIYLPLDTQQKKMFDAIDGTRTVGKIVGEHGQRDAVRALFEQLWWYDQVVFDTSNSRKQKTMAATGEKPAATAEASRPHEMSETMQKQNQRAGST